MTTYQIHHRLPPLEELVLCVHLDQLIGGPALEVLHLRLLGVVVLALALGPS